MIPQEGIHEQKREIRNEIAEETNPQSVDAALAIRALEPGTTAITASMLGAAKTTRGWESLLIPSMR